MKIGRFHYNPTTRELVDDTGTYPLTYKSHAVLLKLYGSSGNMVSREDLIEEIWEGNYLVGDKALTQCIWSLRKILGEDKDLIETVPKSGYVLHRPQPESNLMPEPQRDEQPPVKRPSARQLLIAIVLAVAVLIVFLTQQNHSHDMAIRWNVSVNNPNAYWQELNQTLLSQDISVKKLALLQSSEEDLQLSVSLTEVNGKHHMSLTLKDASTGRHQVRTLSQNIITPQILSGEVSNLLNKFITN